MTDNDNAKCLCSVDIMFTIVYAKIYVLHPYYTWNQSVQNFFSSFQACENLKIAEVIAFHSLGNMNI